MTKKMRGHIWAAMWWILNKNVSKFTLMCKYELLSGGNVTTFLKQEVSHLEYYKKHFSFFSCKSCPIAMHFEASILETKPNKTCFSDFWYQGSFANKAQMNLWSNNQTERGGIYQQWRDGFWSNFVDKRPCPKELFFFVVSFSHLEDSPPLVPQQLVIREGEGYHMLHRIIKSFQIDQILTSMELDVMWCWSDVKNKTWLHFQWSNISEIDVFLFFYLADGQGLMFPGASSLGIESVHISIACSHIYECYHL